MGLRAGLTGWVGDAYSEKVTSWLAGEGGTHPLVGHHLRPFPSDIHPIVNEFAQDYKSYEASSKGIVKARLSVGT